jgi:hypothetical protein
MKYQRLKFSVEVCDGNKVMKTITTEDTFHVLTLIAKKHFEGWVKGKFRNLLPLPGDKEDDRLKLQHVMKVVASASDSFSTSCTASLLRGIEELITEDWDELKERKDESDKKEKAEANKPSMN